MTRRAWTLLPSGLAGEKMKATGPARLEVPIESKQLADVVLATALEKKAFEPVLLAVADVVGYADWFVIVSARNPRQVRAIAEKLKIINTRSIRTVTRACSRVKT